MNVVMINQWKTITHCIKINYRTISGERKLSDHSFGKAIDINPIFNPHVKKNKISPPEGKEYLDRDKWQHGVIQKQDCVVKRSSQGDGKWEEIGNTQRLSTFL